MAFGDIFTGSNLIYVAGAIFVIILVWTLLRLLGRKGGRLGEEIVKEGETKQLERDEVKQVRILREEKKECDKMEEIVLDIYSLANTFFPDLYL